MEGINDAMDQELNELRQQYYQKQLRKQREQRVQHRQQQQQQGQLWKEPQTQQQQLYLRQQTETTSRSTENPKRRSVYFAQQGKGIHKPLFERKK